MNIDVIKIDSACVAPDTKVDANVGDAIGIELIENDEYKYLSAFPLFENGDFAPVASKDLESWVICYGARLNGKALNLLDLVDQIKDRAK